MVFGSSGAFGGISSGYPDRVCGGDKSNAISFILLQIRRETEVERIVVSVDLQCDLHCTGCGCCVTLLRVVTNYRLCWRLSLTICSSQSCCLILLGEAFLRQQWHKEVARSTTGPNRFSCRSGISLSSCLDDKPVKPCNLSTQ